MVRVSCPYFHNFSLASSLLSRGIWKSAPQQQQLALLWQWQLVTCCPFLHKSKFSIVLGFVDLDIHVIVGSISNTPYFARCVIHLVKLLANKSLSGYHFFSIFYSSSFFFFLSYPFPFLRPSLSLSTPPSIKTHQLQVFVDFEGEIGNSNSHTSTGR